MDFLKNVKQKLAEFEEQARQAQEKARREFEQQQKSASLRDEKERLYKPVEADSCPVDEVRSESSNQNSGSTLSGSLFENLGEHLDQAFVLQEILGQPRCMREWD